MPDVTPQAHHQVLSAVREVRGKVRALRDSTKLKNGYMGFDLADTMLAELHEAIATRSRDRDQIILWLKNAVTNLKLVGGGDVRPAVEQAELAFEALWKDLDAIPSGSP